jgi:hypothetical protein
VTWLYGLLQHGPAELWSPDSPWYSQTTLHTSLDKSNKRFLSGMLTLKKCNISEIVLSRSLSPSSPLKRAAPGAVPAQHSKRLYFTGGKRTYLKPPKSPPAHEYTGILSSISSSGVVLPWGSKYAHFNEQVEQCIAVKIKEDSEEVSESLTTYDYNDINSDDKRILTRCSNLSRNLSPPHNKKTTSQRSSSESKTIAMLPPTKIKYRIDTPELAEPTSQSDSSKGDSRLSCPFRKYNTHRYSVHSHRVCALSYWGTIARVKYVSFSL